MRGHNCAILPYDKPPVKSSTHARRRNISSGVFRLRCIPIPSSRPAFGLTGAALALAASNGLAFLYRSITGQMYYRTVASYPKTISGFLLAFAVTAAGTLLWQHFVLKFVLTGAVLFIYCTLYRAQLLKLWNMGLGILRGLLKK